MPPADEEIVGIYQRHGRAWAVDRGNRLYEKAWLDRFRALMPADSNILDIGCGSAEPIGRYFIENGYNVTGVDSSPQLIALCRERFPDQQWQIADMRTLSLEQTFGGLLAWDSFFHLNHDYQRRMFPLFRKHAAARAALMFTSGTSDGVSIGAYQGEPLYHASLDSLEYRALLEANGFEVISHGVEDPTCGGRTVWLAHLR
jgi:SAM-dependent methyltransferase